MSVAVLIFAASFLVLIQCENSIKPLSVKTCPVKGKALNIKFNLKDTPTGEKSFSGEIELPFDVTEKVSLSALIEISSPIGYVKLTSMQDNVCKLITDYVPKAFAKLQKAMVPEMKGTCNFKAGSYKVSNFQALTSDLNLPFSLKGKYRITAKLYSPEEKEVACFAIEILGTK